MTFTKAGLYVSYRLVYIKLECQITFQMAMEPVFFGDFMKASLTEPLIIS